MTNILYQAEVAFPRATALSEWHLQLNHSKVKLHFAFDMHFTDVLNAPRRSTHSPVDMQVIFTPPFSSRRRCILSPDPFLTLQNNRAVSIATVCLQRMCLLTYLYFVFLSNTSLLPSLCYPRNSALDLQPSSRTNATMTGTGIKEFAGQRTMLFAVKRLTLLRACQQRLLD